MKGTGMRWARCVARIGMMKILYKVLDRKPEGMRPLGRQSCRWGFNIRINVKETGWENRKLVSTGSG
jgi:hypothetical protein